MLEIYWIWARKRIRFRRFARIRWRPWGMRSILRNSLRERYHTLREGHDFVRAMSRCRLISWSTEGNCVAPWHWARKSFPDVWVSQQMTITWLRGIWSRPIHGYSVRINILSRISVSCSFLHSSLLLLKDLYLMFV